MQSSVTSTQDSVERGGGLGGTRLVGVWGGHESTPACSPVLSWGGKLRGAGLQKQTRLPLLNELG